MFLKGRRDRKKNKGKAPTPVDEGPSLYEIGKSGTAEQFRAANQRAVDKQTAPENWDHAGKYVEHRGAGDQRELRRGAVQAFKEEHPENILTALLNLEEFAIHDSFTNRWYSRERDASENIISDLIREGNDPSAVIKLALLANVTPDEKQELLDKTLLGVATDRIPGGKAFIDALVEAGAHELPVAIDRVWLADVPQDKKQERLDNRLFGVIKGELSGGEILITGLLDAGADANAAENGYNGLALAYAVKHDQPLSVIEALYKNKKKASFDEAIESMEATGWDDGLVYRMKVLREKFTGTPAAVKIQPEVLQKLLDDYKAAQEEIVALRDAAQEKPRPATRLIRPQA